MRGSNTQCLNGKPIKSDLEALLQSRVLVANDANCFAIAESTLGAAAGYPTVFGIIMGTGCGGGYFAHGRILSGCHGIGGEWGQIVVEPGGERSPHGTIGTVEAYIAGPALEKFYMERAGAKKLLKEIAEQEMSDPFARETIERLQHYFARSLAAVIDTFDPHAIVIGGGVGNIEALYSEKTREMIRERIFAPSFEAALLKPALGDSAGVFGAAMLATLQQ